MDPNLLGNRRYYRYLPLLAFAMASAICYGSITTFANLSYEYGVQVEHLVFFRGVLVAFVCIVLIRSWDTKLRFRQLGDYDVLRLSLALVITSYCQLTAVRYIPVSLTVVIFYIFPVLVVLVENFSNLGRQSLHTLLLPLLAFAGVVIAVAPHVDQLDHRGLAFAIVAAVAMAASILVAKKALKNTSVLALAFASNLVASTMVFVYWLLSGLASLPENVDGLATALSMIVVVGMLFAFGLIFQFISINRIGGSTTSLILNFEPIVTIVAAAMIVRETVTYSTIVGALLILTAVVCFPYTMMRS